MKEINDKIQKAIEENLPKQMGDVLQKRFAELEKIESDHNDLKQLYENQSNDVKALRKDLEKTGSDLAIKEEILKDISEREKAVTARENAAEVNELKYKLDESEKRAVEMHGLVQTVFKSPVYRKSYNLIGGMEATGNKDTYGNEIFHNPKDKTGDVTETVE